MLVLYILRPAPCSLLRTPYSYLLQLSSASLLLSLTFVVAALTLSIVSASLLSFVCATPIVLAVGRLLARSR